jgi:hypothetical protein
MWLMEGNRMITHCQICMRAIKTVRGYAKQDTSGDICDAIIAHHGFQRPRHWHGAQTASCMGAKYRPIEVACDALPVVIEHLKDFIGRNETHLADFLANPPATLEYEIDRNFRWKHGNKGTVARPDDFAERDVDQWYEQHGRYSMQQTYMRLYRDHRNELMASIKNARRDLAEFEQRLASWKPAQEAAA